MSKAHGFHKKPSKRVPARRRYKVEKKVREHHRRMRKMAKKEGLKKKSKKEILSMPRDCPFSLEDWHGLTYLSPKEAAKLKRAKEREQQQQQQQQEATVVSALAPEFDVSKAAVATESTPAEQVSAAISNRLKKIRQTRSEKNALNEQELNPTLKKKVKNARKMRQTAKASQHKKDEEPEEMQVAFEEDEAYDFETHFN